MTKFIKKEVLVKQAQNTNKEKQHSTPKMKASNTNKTESEKHSKSHNFEELYQLIRSQSKVSPALNMANPAESKKNEIEVVPAYNVKSIDELQNVGNWILKAVVGDRRFTRHKNSNNFIGGFVEDSAFASKTVYIGKRALVLEHAQVLDNAELFGKATVSGNSKISGYAWVYGNSNISDNVKISDKAKIYGDIIDGNIKISGNVKLSGEVEITGKLELNGNYHLWANVKIDSEEKLKMCIESQNELQKKINGPDPVSVIEIEENYSPIHFTKIEPSHIDSETAQNK
jgi:hypothetical protein